MIREVHPISLRNIAATRPFFCFFRGGGLGRGFRADWQAGYVREWLVKAGLEEEAENLNVLFYPARYHEAYGSIFALTDLVALVRRFSIRV